jgi:hypothetical protein
MNTRIAIYGGTNLTAAVVRFVERLTRRILAFPDVVLVSGGFAQYRGRPDRISVDRAVLEESERRLDPGALATRFETWLPAPSLDRRSVERFRHGTVRELQGSAQARRFAVVTGVDAIITIAGEGQTRTVLELALAIKRPALPVAFTGGDSARVWARSREAVANSLRLDPTIIRRLESTPRGAAERDRLADDVARAAHAAAERRCLVLMPFGPGHDGFYTRVLRPAIGAAGYVPIRIDQDEYAGDIPTLFRHSVERAHAILVDVTGANPNVMYELGYLHARGLDPPAVILRQRLTARASAALPFYLRHERLITAPDDEAGHSQLRREVVAYLGRVDRRRRGVSSGGLA